MGGGGNELRRAPAKAETAALFKKRDILSDGPH